MTDESTNDLFKRLVDETTPQYDMTGQPGPELDRKVAEAIGWKRNCVWESQGCNHYGNAWLCTQCGIVILDDAVPTKPCLPAFSTDWSAAMLAAEEFGLFEWPRTLSRSLSGSWMCSSLGAVLGHAPTGPHAISLAILKLAQQGEQNRGHHQD